MVVGDYDIDELAKVRGWQFSIYNDNSTRAISGHPTWWCGCGAGFGCDPVVASGPTPEEAIVRACGEMSKHVHPVDE